MRVKDYRFVSTGGGRRAARTGCCGLPVPVRLGLVLAAMLCPMTVLADLVIQFGMGHTTLQRLEAANAFVTISNRSSDVVMLDPDQGEGHAWVEFNVRRMSERSPVEIKGKAAPVRGELSPGESRRFMVELTSLYNLGQLGTYNISATVRQGELAYESRMMSIEVVTGLPLKQVSGVLPGGGNAVREYSLMYLSREGREELLLSIDEDVSGLNYGVFVLGPIVRVFEPVLSVDGAGTVTVVHQTGPQQYARSILQTTAGGVRLVDQSYENLRSRTGAKGAWTAPGANPVTPPGVTPAPKKKGIFGF